MVFQREPPRQVEIMRAAAAPPVPSPPPSSAHGGEPLRAAAMKEKPRSRLSQAQTFNSGDGAPSTGRSHDDDRLEQIRAKLMDHLREAAGRIELPLRKETPPEPEKDAEKPPEELPWSLRKRRSTATGRQNQPNNPGASNLTAVLSLEAAAAAPPPPKPTTRLRSGGAERREAAAPRRRRPRFAVPLSKEEIDEDLYAFTGRRNPRRPKKRPRAVQKQLDVLFPGLWLSEVTAETYLVAEPPPL